MPTRRELESWFTQHGGAVTIPGRGERQRRVERASGLPAWSMRQELWSAPAGGSLGSDVRRLRRPLRPVAVEHEGRCGQHSGAVIDYNAVKNTIAHEQNIELLRVVVAILLGEVEERRNRLAKLDPLAEPAFRRERSDATRSQMAAT
jgi:hypothetical protein